MLDPFPISHLPVFGSLHEPLITQLTGRSRRHDGASRHQHRTPVTISANQLCPQKIAAHLSTRDCSSHVPCCRSRRRTGACGSVCFETSRNGCPGAGVAAHCASSSCKLSCCLLKHTLCGSHRRSILQSSGWLHCSLHKLRLTGETALMLKASCGRIRQSATRLVLTSQVVFAYKF